MWLVYTAEASGFLVGRERRGAHSAGSVPGVAGLSQLPWAAPEGACCQPHHHALCLPAPPGHREGHRLWDQVTGYFYWMHWWPSISPVTVQLCSVSPLSSMVFPSTPHPQTSTGEELTYSGSHSKPAGQGGLTWSRCFTERAWPSQWENDSGRALKELMDKD